MIIQGRSTPASNLLPIRFHFPATFEKERPTKMGTNLFCESRNSLAKAAKNHWDLFRMCYRLQVRKSTLSSTCSSQCITIDQMAFTDQANLFKTRLWCLGRELSNNAWKHIFLKHAKCYVWCSLVKNLSKAGIFATPPCQWSSCCEGFPRLTKLEASLVSQ